MDDSSPVEGSVFLGPPSVRRTPRAEAFLDLAKSNMSTPIHASNAQLSGPEIPGAQISEAGNLVLTVNNALSSIPLLLESCGASIITISDG